MSDQIRPELKRAAAVLFTRHGFAATRVADIVAKAGVAQGTFYLHFENKPSIFVELVDDFFSGLLEETLGWLPVEKLQTRAQVAEEIEIIWNAVIRYCRRNRSLTKLVLRETQALPAEQRNHINRHFEQGSDTLAQYVEHAQKLGLIKDLPARLAAWLVIGLIERTMHYSVLIAPDAPSEVLAAHCTEFELHGLLAAGCVDGEEQI